jgi:hypothetical protein
MNMSEQTVEVIDEEWFKLILEARDIGLSVEMVQRFLKQRE